MNVFLWHVHGAYTSALVRGRHRYLVPVLPDHGPDGLGRASTYAWPETVVEVRPDEAKRAEVDVVLLQRPVELEGLAEDWLGRRPGRDVPAVYLEHNVPQGRINEMRHLASDRDDLLLVHCTHFNALFWDSGATRVRVVEHGVIDPGHRYSGELGRAAAVINEPGRRARVVGADLLDELKDALPIDLYGMKTPNDLPQARLHYEIAMRRVYLHPYRWTSLGLALLEAMHLGMPVVALATTETPLAVPASAGVVSNRVADLREALAWLREDPAAARRMGEAARACALERYGLRRFLDDWDSVFEEVAA
jgi:glycosyltransferase involved in cell wall biosynthesis